MRTLEVAWSVVVECHQRLGKIVLKHENSPSICQRKLSLLITHCLLYSGNQVQQGTDLIDLRLTWRIRFLGDFSWFLETFLSIFRDFFEEFWRNWFVVRRLRTSDLHLVSASWKFLTMNKKVWFWPPNGLGGQIWPQIWNLWPKLHM